MALRFLRPVLLSLALISTGACESSGSSSSGAAPTAEPMTPVPAPAGLLADILIPSPATTWTKVRSGVGGPTVLMPASLGGLVAALAGLPITVAPEVDEAVPAVGAMMREGKGPLLVTLGVHVKSGERFVAQLTKGEAARFRVVVDGTSRVSLLTPKTSPENARVALGVLGNYLLIGQKPADLNALGPYVARTLPTHAMPKEEVAIEMSEAALQGPMTELAREMRSRGEGAAAALIPLGSMLDGLIGLFGDATHARVTLTFEPQRVHARATITPKPGTGPGGKLLAELPIGDVKPLLDLPEPTTLGVMWRESPASRAETAPKQAEALAHILGKDVTADDRAAITAALRAEAEARGEWQAVGIAFNGTGPTAVVRAPVPDADKMKKALKQLVDLASLPSFQKALTGLGLSVSSEKAVVENVKGDVVRVHLARPSVDKDAKGKPEKGKAKDAKAKDAKGDAKKPPEPPPGVPNAIDLLYLVNGDGLFASAGFDPKDALLALVRAPSGPNLASVAPMAAALSDVSDASFVLVADALRIAAVTSGAPPGAPSPALIAAGRSASPAELWARADVPFALVGQLVVDLARRSAAPPSPLQAPVPIPMATPKK
jgi:hypothetical protein